MGWVRVTLEFQWCKSTFCVEKSSIEKNTPARERARARSVVRRRNVSKKKKHKFQNHNIARTASSSVNWTKRARASPTFPLTNRTFIGFSSPPSLASNRISHRAKEFFSGIFLSSAAVRAFAYFPLHITSSRSLSIAIFPPLSRRGKIVLFPSNLAWMVGVCSPSDFILSILMNDFYDISHTSQRTANLHLSSSRLSHWSEDEEDMDHGQLESHLS